MSEQNRSGPVPPYGPPIREAYASGDTTRMRQVAENARQWLEQNPGHEKQGEVHAELRKLQERLGGAEQSFSGTAKPYGAPIRDAIASGDTTRMRQVGESARRWLSDNPGDEKHGDVHAALRDLDDALGGR